MIVLWFVLLACCFVNLFYVWKLEHDFQEWAMDINVEFFKDFKNEE